MKPMKKTLAFAIALLLGSSFASAQPVVEETENLEFDAPESWAMKYYASLAILTGMGVPEAMGAGKIDLGFEGGFVPAQVRGRVVRCQVASIAGGRLQYQSGIAFDSRIELPGVDAPGASTAAMPTPADATARGGAAGVPSPGEIRNRW